MHAFVDVYDGLYFLFEHFWEGWECDLRRNIPILHSHHLMRSMMRRKSMVSNPIIEYKSELSNLVEELAQSVII